MPCSHFIVFSKQISALCLYTCSCLSGPKTQGDIVFLNVVLRWRF
uniref:Uncharacterized protein n=1 Tax=Anguilla anguilla TaxID=7936 RepID=A0A0E9QIK1_ANGAN